MPFRDCHKRHSFVAALLRDLPYRVEPRLFAATNSLTLYATCDRHSDDLDGTHPSSVMPYTEPLCPIS